jgi:hypothetical protein
LKASQLYKSLFQDKITEIPILSLKQHKIVFPAKSKSWRPIQLLKAFTITLPNMCYGFPHNLCKTILSMFEEFLRNAILQWTDISIESGLAAVMYRLVWFYTDGIQNQLLLLVCSLTFSLLQGLQHQLSILPSLSISLYG